MSNKLQEKLSVFTNNLYTLSMREAFIALIPFFVIAGLASLLSAVLQLFQLLPADSWLLQSMSLANFMLVYMFPMAIVVSVSYYLSKNLGVNTIVGSLLAMACFLVVSDYWQLVQGQVIVELKGASAYSILVPLFTTVMVAQFKKLKWLKVTDSQMISPFLRKHLNLILPFASVFFITLTVIPIIAELLSGFFTMLAMNTSQWSVEALTLTRMVLVHGFWFVGVHGDNFYMSVFDQSFMANDILPNLSAKTFYNTFVIVGGTGCFWGLIVAIFWINRRGHDRSLAKLSLPFTCFNFCEILLYALPIVFNPYLLIPFILAPLVNFVVAYLVLQAGWVPYYDVNVPWMTPTLLSGWIVGQSFITVLFQLFLILMNAAIYWPFVQMNFKSNSSETVFEKLSQKLSIGAKIEGDGERQFHSNITEQVAVQRKARDIAAELEQGQLQLYYQPKIDIRTESFCGFEALLRFKNSSGKVVGPYFLDDIISGGYSYIIDKWVINQAHNDLDAWARQGFRPKVSINLSPDMMLNHDLIEILLRRFKAFPNQLEVELLESAYIDNHQAVRNNIALLKNSHIDAAIDDFGTGYSSLSLLTRINADTIKLDRALLLESKTENGAILFEQLCSLCHRLGFKLVAEGVETEAQLEFVKAAGIDVVQGWYYAAALPAQSAKAFAVSFPDDKPA